MVHMKESSLLWAELSLGKRAVIEISLEILYSYRVEFTPVALQATSRLQLQSEAAYRSFLYSGSELLGPRHQ